MLDAADGLGEGPEVALDELCWAKSAVDSQTSSTIDLVQAIGLRQRIPHVERILIRCTSFGHLAVKVCKRDPLKPNPRVARVR